MIVAPPYTTIHILTVRNAKMLGTFVPPHPDVPIYEPFPNSCIPNNENNTNLTTFKKESESEE